MCLKDKGLENQRLGQKLNYFLDLESSYKFEKSDEHEKQKMCSVNRLNSQKY